MISAKISIKPVGYPSMEDFTRRFHRLRANFETKLPLSVTESVSDRLQTTIKSNVLSMLKSGTGSLYNNIRTDVIDGTHIEVSAPDSDDYWVALEKGSRRHWVPRVTIIDRKHLPSGGNVPLEGLGMREMWNRPFNFVRSAVEMIQDELPELVGKVLDNERKEVGL